MNTRYKKLLLVTLILSLCILSLPISAFCNEIQPYASYATCPNCDNKTLQNLGHIYRSWKGNGSGNTCDLPARPEYDHQHTFTLDYYLHRCTHCNYEVKRNDYSTETCDYTGRTYKYED